MYDRVYVYKHIVCVNVRVCASINFYTAKPVLTCAKCDCTCLVESLMDTGCDENCDTSVLLRVTDLASLANLLRPANRSPGVGQGN